MRLLIFCPTAPRLESEVVHAIFSQNNVVAYDVFFTRDNPYPYEDRQWCLNIQHNFEKMRRLVLESYDKVWCVESDTIPPEDGLSRLLEVDAPVVGGLYANRHGMPTPSVMPWAETLRNIAGAMSWDEVKRNWGKTIRVSGNCTGCLLIDKEVLKDFSFITGDRRPPDGPFSEYCFQNNIVQTARLDVICGHKQPNGDTLWPDKDKNLGYRIEKAKQ